MSHTHELGPLPDCYSRFKHEEGTPLYSADQMLAYAAEQVAAERERCITAAEDAYIAGKGAKGCIDAMRALCGPNVRAKRV